MLRLTLSFAATRFHRRHARHRLKLTMMGSSRRPTPTCLSTSDAISLVQNELLLTLRWKRGRLWCGSRMDLFLLHILLNLRRGRKTLSHFKGHRFFFPQSGGFGPPVFLELALDFSQGKGGQFSIPGRTRPEAYALPICIVHSHSRLLFRFGIVDFFLFDQVFILTYVHIYRKNPFLDLLCFSFFIHSYLPTYFMSVHTSFHGFPFKASPQRPLNTPSNGVKHRSKEIPYYYIPCLLLHKAPNQDIYLVFYPLSSSSSSSKRTGSLLKS